MSEKLTIKIEFSEEQCMALRNLAEALSICANVFAKETPTAEVAPPTNPDPVYFETDALRVMRDGNVLVKAHDFRAGSRIIRYEGTAVGVLEPGRWVIYCYDEECQGGERKWRSCKQAEKVLPLGVYIAGIVEVPQR